MIRDPNWNEEEFNVILLNPHSTDEEVSAKLNGRNVKAIASVRAFIHNFHVRGNISGLSKFMISRLEKGYWICPRCYTKVQKHGFPSAKGWVP